MSEPTFLLDGPRGVVRGEGVRTAYPNLPDARAAISSGTAPILVGALPFDVTKPVALWCPEAVHFDAAPALRSPRPLPTVRIERMTPALEEHRARVAAALRILRDPHGGLQKVVLARALHLVADDVIEVGAVLDRLAADPNATTFHADLGAAGGDHVGTALVGASPELLVARRGATVTCRPFAGSAPRSADPATDAARGAALAASQKDRHEHRLVTDEIRAVLDPLCADLRIETEPVLRRTSDVWHLSTSIVGRLREPDTTALDLAIALHPTPAVGGVPRGAATALITALEGDRGFYAGAVGWCDATGDGTWLVSLRCAELSADRRHAVARAGGGIVVESDPDDEVAETTAKFKTILAALEVEPCP